MVLINLSLLSSPVASNTYISMILLECYRARMKVKVYKWFEWIIDFT